MNKALQRLTKRYLYEEYVVKEKSMHQIATENHVAVGTVYNYLAKYGIPGRRHLTAEARQKISAPNIGRISPRKGEHLSEEAKRKISNANTGRYKKPSKYGGHIKRREDGYNAVYAPKHPHASKDGYVMEHTLVMEESIGRFLAEDEVVHHINRDRSDNRISNLQLMKAKEHASRHTSERHKNGDINYHTTPVLNINTGETFNSIKAAAKIYGIAPTNISRACRDTSRTAAGCKWRYA